MYFVVQLELNKPKIYKAKSNRAWNPPSRPYDLVYSHCPKTTSIQQNTTVNSFQIIGQTQNKTTFVITGNQRYIETVSPMIKQLTQNAGNPVIITWPNEQFPIETEYDICFVLSMEYLLLQKFNPSDILPIQAYDSTQTWKAAAISHTSTIDQTIYLVKVKMFFFVVK